MAVADVFDALISRRVYKAALPFAEVHAIMIEQRGLQFDPDLIDAFAGHFEAFCDIARALPDTGCTTAACQCLIPRTPPSRDPTSAVANDFALRVALGYALAGALWIAGSDCLLNLLVQDREWLARVAAVKGWFFVGVTAGLLFWVLHRRMHATAPSGDATPRRRCRSGAGRCCCSWRRWWR
jgi:hypothetical protein